MSTIVKLDATALRELFPVGSESRLELQKQCISLIVRESLTDLLRTETKDELRSMIENSTGLYEANKDDIKDTINEVLKTLVQKVDYRYSPNSNLTKEFSDTLNSTIRLKVSKDIQDTIAKMVHEALYDKFEINDGVKHNIRAYIDQQIKRLTLEHIDKASNEFSESLKGALRKSF